MTFFKFWLKIYTLSPLSPPREELFLLDFLAYKGYLDSSQSLDSELILRYGLLSPWESTNYSVNNVSYRAEINFSDQILMIYTHYTTDLSNDP